MWHENLEGNKFIANLYTEIPKLINVRIAKVEIQDEGNRISISFDMPCFADKIPPKWQIRGYNTVNVHLDFFGIREVSLNSTQNTYRGNLEIQKEETGLLTVKVSGKVDMKIIAESGLIQAVEGYCNQT